MTKAGGRSAIRGPSGTSPAPSTSNQISVSRTFARIVPPRSKSERPPARTRPVLAFAPSRRQRILSPVAVARRGRRRARRDPKTKREGCGGAGTERSGGRRRADGDAAPAGHAGGDRLRGDRDRGPTRARPSPRQRGGLRRRAAGRQHRRREDRSRRRGRRGPRPARHLSDRLRRGRGRPGGRGSGPREALPARRAGACNRTLRPAREEIMMEADTSDATVIAPDPSATPTGEILLEAQKRALEMVVRGAPLADVLDYIARIVDEQAGGDAAAAILLLDDDGRLRPGAGPGLPEEYHRLVDGLTPLSDVGTCCASAVTGEVVVTTDIAADPKWQVLKGLPLGLGLVAAWSQPILARDGRVLGTFGTYFRVPRGPTAIERQLVGVLSHTAA